MESIAIDFVIVVIVFVDLLASLLFFLVQFLAVDFGFNVVLLLFEVIVIVDSNLRRVGIFKQILFLGETVDKVIGQRTNENRYVHFLLRHSAGGRIDIGSHGERLRDKARCQEKLEHNIHGGCNLLVNRDVIRNDCFRFAIFSEL